MKRFRQNIARPTLLFTSLVLVAVVIWGCVREYAYESNRVIDPAGWNISDSVEFDVQVTDTVTPVNFLLSLRHTTDYEYSNIFFFLSTYYPDNTYSRDTIQVLLAGKDGKWYGKGFGKLKEVEVMLKQGVRFPRSGTYRFSFVQAMRTESLTGVEDLGIRIEKIGNRD